MIKCIFKASLLVASAAASLTGVRHGNSSSHSVNQFDLLGNTCPAVSRINEPCPVICVSTLDSCPPALKPSCKAGEFFCRDGKCTAGKSEALACKTARPVCNCEYGFVGEQIGSFYPCLSGQVANVTGLGQGKLGDSPLISKCEGDLSDVLNKQSSFYLQCSTRSNVYLSVFAPEFMAVYCIFSVQVTILIAYTFFRQLKSKSSSFQQVELVGSKGKSDLSFSGFHKSTIGALVKRSIYLTSFMWIFLVAVLIADYYRVFSNFSYREYSQIFIDHDNLSRVFIALWHIMGCWFLVLQVSSGWLETYFLYPAASQVIPDYILVKKRQLDTIEYTNLGGIVQWIHKIEAPFRRFTSTDCTQTLVAVEWTEKQRAYIDFECVRYVYDHGAGSFQPFEFPIGSTLAQLHDGATGLSESEAQRRFHLNGPNQILFKADEFGDAVFKEFSGIFYLYQFMMLVIWAYYAYYYMALLLSVVIIGSGMVKVSVATEGQKRVVAMATYFNIVRVFRDGYWASLDSRCLVPGDLIEIIASQEHALSVDCVLLTGDAVVDESALTGEALPVAKTCVKNEAGPFRTEDHGKRHCLFAGCHVLEAQSAKRVTALVLATGAESVKGTLVRDILYPVPILFVFIEQLKVVFPILLLWGIIMLFASVAMLGVESIDSWFYGMFTISQVLSPLLPAVLVVGQSISAQRLAMKKISCTDFSRITLAGKVKVFCFDKTGTLTKEGLEFIGCNPVSSANLFSEKAIQQTVVEMSPEIKIAMHICHSLATVSGQIVGNFVDVEMFKATRATLDVANQALIYPEAKSKLNTLKIVKRYEFIHSEAYMTVVAQDVVTGRFYCVMKGSFEKLCKCCINCPKDLAQTADSHAKRGCYIVALAYHAFSAQITMEQINEMTREQTQGQSRIVGLMMFRNELKGTTRDAIDHLREGGCRPVMVTGDNAVTAIHVGHECHMFARHVNPINIILIDAAEKRITCTNPELNTTYTLDRVEAMLVADPGLYELAITGAAFNQLSSQGWVQSHLHHIRIFARMSPSDKVKCIRAHMVDNITAMCGDGGNDAGALRQAHTGIALTEADSSVVAHFSSANRSIECCVDLLLEARCALDVSFAAYKYLILYGETLALVGLVQYWMLIDGATVPISWAMTMALPAKRLTSTRPTARLLGPETIMSIMGPLIINLLFALLAIMLLFGQSFFRCHEFDGSTVDLRRWWELADNFEGAVTTIVIMYQILNAAAAFNLGTKYRQGGLQNKIFLTAYGIVFATISFLLLSDPNSLGCQFRINCGTAPALENLGYAIPFNAPTVYHAESGHNVLPLYFRVILFGLMLLNLIAVMGWELVAILGPARASLKQLQQRQPLRL